MANNKLTICGEVDFQKLIDKYIVSDKNGGGRKLIPLFCGLNPTTFVVKNYHSSRELEPKRDRISGNRRHWKLRSVALPE